MTKSAIRAAAALIVCAIAFGATYIAIAPSSTTRTPRVQTPIHDVTPQAHATRVSIDDGSAAMTTETTLAGNSQQTPAEAAERVAHTQLRERVINETGLAMQRRGVSVIDCLSDIEIAVEQRIRFVVQVHSSPTEATVGQWRFAEIVDGQQLPSSFPACAERALGGGMGVVPEGEQRFPSYEGEIATTYRIDPTK